MKKMLVVLALCFAIAAAVGSVFAQGAAAPAAAVPTAPPAVGPMGGPMQAPALRNAPCVLPTLRLISAQMVPMLVVRLSLSDDQKVKVNDLMAKSEADLKPKVENQVKVAREYAATLVSSSAKQADVLAAADKCMKAEGEILSSKIATLFALRALLNDDQNKQLTEYLVQYTSPWRERPAPVMIPAQSKDATPPAPPAAPAAPAAKK